MAHIDVFLGGVGSGPVWWNELISKLGMLTYTYSDHYPMSLGGCVIKEHLYRASCKYVLYVIDVDADLYTVAEAVDSACCAPQRTVVCILEHGIEDHKLKSLRATKRLLQGTNAAIVPSLDDAVSWLIAHCKPN
jgi:hypothetical protein